VPELPEVETVARQLAPLVAGRRVARLLIHDRAKLTPPGVRLADRHVGRVLRVGKRVLIELLPAAAEGVAVAVPGARKPAGGHALWLAVHLRMTGRLVFGEEAPSGTPRPHVRAELVLDRGVVSFIDPRRFGTFEWLCALDEAAPAAVDPTEEAFTPECLAALLQGSPQPLKTWLLRQDRLVGIGNIYASEILWHARLSPFRAAGRLKRDEIGRLHAATRAVLAAAIEACGTTFSDFQDAHGLTGSYQRFLAVYEREGDPCPRCEAPVARRTQAQRSTYWCPACLRKVRYQDPAARTRSSARPR
jgi:formamidopyrimidine-DNA glycosylase